MSKKILITGGAGFIGSNLALKLLTKGYEVTILDNLSPQIHARSETSTLFRSVKGKVRFINGDVRKEDDWILALKEQEIVVHLAAETGTGQSMYQINHYADVNVRGTAILLDLLVNKKHRIEKVIIASSRAIYGEGKYRCNEHGVVYPKSRLTKHMQKGDFEPKCPLCESQVKLLPTDENSKIHPTSVYGITKHNQEAMVSSVCGSIGVDFVGFRYQNVFGPGQSLKNPYTGILSIFTTQIRNNNDINIFEDGKESRDFVYIDDVVDATILGIEKEEANNEVFNVGSGVPTSVIDIATSLNRYWNNKVNVKISGDFRIGDIRHNYACLAQIQNKLEFMPKFDFRRGLNNFLVWVEGQEVNEDKYVNSISELAEKGLYK